MAEKLYDKNQYLEDLASIQDSLQKFRENYDEMGAVRVEAPSQAQELTPIEQPKTGFFQRIKENLSNYVTGKAPLMPTPAKSLPGKIGKGIVNFAGAVVRPALNYAKGGLEVPGQLISSSIDKDSIEMVRKAYEQFDDLVAKRIDQLKSEPGGEDKIQRLREFLVANPMDQWEPGAMPSLDKGLTQILGEGVSTALLGAGLFGKHVGHLPGVNKIYNRLGLNGAGGLLDSYSGMKIAEIATLPKAGIAEAIRSMLPAVPFAFGEGAAFNVAMLLADKPAEQISKKEMDDAVLFGGAFGVLLGLPVNRFFGLRSFNKTLDAVDIAKDLVETARINPNSVIAPSLTSTRIHIPFTKTKKITAIEEITDVAQEMTAEGLKKRNKNLSKALVGDTVRTKSGVIGNIRGVVTRTADDEKAILKAAEETRTRLTNELNNLDANLQKDVELAQTLLSQRKVREVPEGLTPELVSDIVDVPTHDEHWLSVDQLVKRKDKRKADLLSILKGLRQMSSSYVPKQEKMVKLLTKDGEIEVFLDDVLGGRITQRTFIEPTEEGLAKLSRGLNEARATMTPASPRTIKVPLSNGKTGDANIDSFLDIASKHAISKEETLNMLRQHQLLDTGFAPGQVTLLDRFRSYFSVFRKLGIDASDYGKAEVVAEQEIEKFRASLKNRIDNVLKEATESKKTVYTRLFKALDGNAEALSTLRNKAERDFVDTAKRHAEKTFKLVNAELRRMGLPPIRARNNYITHLLTDTARVYRKHLGGYPQELMELLRPGTRTPGKYLDQLLEKRGANLPFQEDPIKALDAMYRAHTRFAYLNPEYQKISALRDYFASRGEFGASLSKANLNFLDRALAAFSGRPMGFEEWEGLGRNFEKFLMSVDRFIGKDIFSTKLPPELLEKGMIGAERVPRPGVIKAVDAFLGAPGWVKRAHTIATLSFSPQYAVTNLTQYWLNTPPQLRGGFIKTYRDMTVGLFKAFKDFLSPKERLKWQRSGILPNMGNIIDYELGAFGGGVFNKASSVVSRFTEFMNRVGTYYAVNENVIKGLSEQPRLFRGVKDAIFGKRQLKLNPEWVNEFKAQDMASMKKAIDAHAKSVANLTQFRVGVGTKAPIGEGPIGQLYDHYNTFWRAQVDMIKHSYDDFMSYYKKSPNGSKEATDFWKEAEKQFKKGTIVDFLSSDFVKNMPKGQKGAFIRYIANAGIMTTAIATLGGSFAAEFFAGGLPTFAEGAAGFVKGVFTGDYQKMKDSAIKIALPVSFPPLFDAINDTLYLVKDPEQAMKSVDNIGVKIARKAKVASYSPFRKALVSVDAFRALISGEPVPIRDPRTYEPKEYIMPGNALSTLLFGYRTESSKERVRLLKQIKKARNEATHRQQQDRTFANEVYEKWYSLDAQGKKDLFYELEVGNKIDKEFMNNFLDIAHARTLRETVVEKDLKTLAAPERAELLMEYYFPSLEPEEVQPEKVRLYHDGVITKDVLIEMIKRKKTQADEELLQYAEGQQ